MNINKKKYGMTIHILKLTTDTSECDFDIKFHYHLSYIFICGFNIFCGVNYSISNPV